MICCKPFSINVSEIACGESTDWENNPGTCRLQIVDFNAADWVDNVCPGVTFGTAWDGKFGYFAGSGIYTLTAAGVPAYKLNTRYLRFDSRIVLVAHPILRYWAIELTAFGEASQLYVARKADPEGSPLGEYLVDAGGGCMSAPATVEIEAYVP